MTGLVTARRVWDIGRRDSPPSSWRNRAVTQHDLEPDASVTLADGGTVGYFQMQDGTLALGEPVTANVFHLNGGEIAQAAGADLTIDGERDDWSGTAFTWTGGLLNSTTNLANVIITGITTTALFAPANAGTVVSGSTITLDGGAAAEMKAGDIAMANNAVFNIEDGCTMATDPGTYGNLKVTGGSVAFDAGGGSRRDFGQLMVNGNVTWTGGTYSPYVDADNNDDGDLWYATGTFSIGGTAAITPTGIDSEGSVATPASNMHWQLFVADEGITNANGTPSLTAGWDFDKDPNNPKTWWDLKKT